MDDKSLAGLIPQVDVIVEPSDLACRLVVYIISVMIGNLARIVRYLLVSVVPLTRYKIFHKPRTLFQSCTTIKKLE